MTLKRELWYLPRPATKYPGCYPLHFERRLKNILGTENYIHLFSGMSTTGLRIDINPDTNPDVIADVHNLPFMDECFDGAMADPPYTEEFAKNLYDTDYPQWSKWTKEMSRVVKKNGKIGVMQNYIVPRIVKCMYDEIIVILLRIKQYPKIVTVQVKNE